MAADTLSIYDDLMRFKPAGLTPNGWAVLAGVSRTVWTDMKRHGNPSRRTLEKLLQAAGSSLAEFEALRISGIPASEGLPAGGLADRRPGWGPPEVSPMSLLKTSVAGEWRPGSKIELMEISPTEVLAHLPRPLSLANDLRAYAMTIVGDSMWPRFRPGRCVAVSPKSPIAIGDDIVVRLGSRGEGGAVSIMVKELVGRTDGGFQLRQFNPDVTFQVPATDVSAIEKVVGEMI